MTETQPELWRTWQDVLLKTANEPAMVDGAEHILWIRKRPDGFCYKIVSSKLR